MFLQKICWLVLSPPVRLFVALSTKSYRLVFPLFTERDFASPWNYFFYFLPSFFLYHKSRFFMYLLDAVRSDGALRQIPNPVSDFCPSIIRVFCSEQYMKKKKRKLDYDTKNKKTGATITLSARRYRKFFN